MMQHTDAVPNLGLARCYAAGGDSAQEAVVLHHGHQHGERVRGAVRRRGYVPDNGVQQGVHRRILRRAACLGQHTVCPSLQHTLLGPAKMWVHIIQRLTCTGAGLYGNPTYTGFDVSAHQGTESALLPASRYGVSCEIPGSVTMPLLSRCTCLADA